MQRITTNSQTPPPPQSIEEIKSKSYHTQDILGCKHYARNCKIKAACCGRIYVCRLCHADDPVNIRHEINRHATKEVLCMFCQTLQPVSNQCINSDCLKEFARYFCDVCKFYDDSPTKQIFHCDKCGICRIGNRNNFIHCDRCNGCLNKDGFNSHKCIENKFSNCPICMEDLFSSRESSLPFDCGHMIHSSCYNEFIKSGSFKCPLCKKSIGKMHWKHTDNLIKRSKMPEMYSGSTVSILCNDCQEKCIDQPFHFIGTKCTSCGSYNTTTTSRNIIIDETKDSSFTVVRDGNDDDEEENEEDEDEEGERLEVVVEDEDDEDDIIEDDERESNENNNNNN
ncbi:hypothetical protein ACTA71_008400 [Dictyostelium dimigraforme]